MTHIHYDLFGAGYPNPESTTFNFDIELSDRVYTYCFGNRCGIKVNTMWEFAPVNNNRNMGELGISEVPKYLQVKQLLDGNPDIQCIMFYEFFDKMHLDNWGETFEYCIDRLGADNVKVIGNIASESFDAEYIPYWFLACDTFFKKYTDEEIKPYDTFTNTYLCYNRKPSGHRIKLQYEFMQNNLLDEGVFTMGLQNKVYETWEERPPHYRNFSENGYGMQSLMSGDDETYGIPADAFSLGNLDIWKKSFLCIVTETLGDQRDEHYIPLLTEKTYKPIIGMRPFMVVGETTTHAKLRELGFYTFEADFPADPVEAVKFLSGEKLEALYQKLLPRLISNKRAMARLVSDRKRNYNCLDL